MKLSHIEIKELISFLGFKPQDGSKDIYYKAYNIHKNYIIKVNFDKESIEYGINIILGDLTTCNFENSENFVVLECVNRILEKGYPPERLSLEYKWPMGRKEKGKLDILIKDGEDNTYLMIECKTWGEEYEKEKKKMLRDGGQLFSYFQQDKSAQYLCLYASKLIKGQIYFVNEIVPVDEQWKELNNQKEIYFHWNKNFKDNGIFDAWADAYNIEIKALTKGRLKELTEEDSGRIFNQFAEILRHNVVSDKPNAFNKILNLFICKIIDEDRSDDEELYFQWKENDTHEKLQLRLNDLYKEGMMRFLDIDVTDYTDKQLESKMFNIDEPEIKKQILDMFQHLRLQKNPEFAFKEVFNDKSFFDNSQVVKEVVELLQPFKFRYGRKQQFLGDFFELLLNTSIKQESGQFFTPVPIAKFIISCFPIKEFIERKINNNEADILPFVIDYAAGSGHFLTEWMDELHKIINSIKTEKIRPTAQRKIQGWKINDFEWAKDYVYGIEADYRLVKTSKVSSFLNGDGEALIIRADGLDNFQKSNDYKGKLKEVSQEDVKDNAQFDILVANPPYSVSAFKNTLKYGEESFELYKRLTDESSEIECLFIERTKQLLKPGGWAGIILPSSILSNSGIYIAAREIILKYFNIKAIAEFGSNTFMATGTNTVTLFLERKPNTEWKKILSSVKHFFNNPNEATVNGIEKAFSKYVSSVFEGLELTDYISLVNKKPNENIIQQELYKEYKTWFDSLTEIKQLKSKRLFINKTKVEQQSELNKIFYEKVFAIEQDKMLYFFLVNLQQTLIIKTNKGLAKTKDDNKKENKEEKDFIGYEFSGRRGHEGIKMYRNENNIPTTKLYDDENHLNPKKVNSYVYRSFLGKKYIIEESLEKNIIVYDTLELFDFAKLAFEKSISLCSNKKVQVNTKWNKVKIESALKPIVGFTTKIQEAEILERGNIPVVTQEINKLISGYSNNQNTITDFPLIVFGDHNCAFKYVDFEFVRGADGTQLLKPIDDFLPKYFYYALQLVDITNRNKYERHLKYLKDEYIPIPPKTVQEKIIKEINEFEQKEKNGRVKVEKLNSEMEYLYQNINSKYNKSKISNHIEIIGGGTPSTKESSYWNGDIPWLSVVDFNNENRFVYDTQKKITKKGLENSSTKYLNTGDLIISARGTVGAIAQLAIPMTFNQSCYGIRGKNDFENGFLYYVLKYEIEQLKANASGAIFDAITTKTFDSIYIPTPSIQKQKQIIAEFEKLEKQISKIENDLSNIDKEKEIILKKYLE